MYVSSGDKFWFDGDVRFLECLLVVVRKWFE